MKRLLAVLLFFGFSVSIIHPYLIDSAHSEQVEQALLLDVSSKHGDLCDWHFVFHTPFTLDRYALVLLKVYHKSARIISQKDLHSLYIPIQLIKPPIA